jgi:transposase
MYTYLMAENQDLRSRLAIGRKRDGRRQFDEGAIEELVELCLKPGVSVARTAMDHDVNPNQLRRWITRYQQRQLAQAARVGESEPAVFDGVQIDIAPRPGPALPERAAAPAFIPVVAAPPAAVATVPSPETRSAALALHVRLPNGVQFDVGEARAEELMPIIQMLGRLACSALTKD